MADREPDQYDAMGAEYEKFKQTPTSVAEEATVTAALPALTGKAVLDVASGTGYYSRLFRRLGASRVVGVDASAEMVKHAQSVEEREPLNISYQQHDATQLPVLGSFDVISAVWLFGYAEGEAALAEMSRRLRANLAEDGTLVALFPNPDADHDSSPEYEKYGLSYARTRSVSGRQGVLVRVLSDPPVELEGFFWPPGKVETALQDAGFTDVRRQPTTIPEEAMAERGQQFWKELLASPHFAVITARAGS